MAKKRILKVSNGVEPPKRWRGGGGGVNFEKLKLLGEIFFIIRGASSYGRAVIMVTKLGHNSGQNNYHTITFFFSRKSNFYGNFQRKNIFDFYIISFKRNYVKKFLFYVAFYYDFLITHL